MLTKQQLIISLGTSLCRLQGVANGQPTEDQRNTVNRIIDCLSSDITELCDLACETPPL